MADPGTAMTAIMVVQAAFQAFLNSEVGKASVGKASEVLTEKGLAQIEQLRQKIWSRMRFKSKKMQELATTVEQTQQITPAQMENVAAYLQVEMDKDDQFAAEVKQLAHEITLMQIENHSSMTQINYGGTNYQTKTGADNTNFFGGTHHYGQK